MRVQTINLNVLRKPTDESSGTEKKQSIEPLQTPWGSYVNLELGEAAPQVDFVVRRHQMPSQVCAFASVKVFAMDITNRYFNES